MIRLLFVDDEPSVLDGLRRSLRSMRNEWEMRFACGGAEALTLLGESPADVVVSDMRMPGMNGVEFLKQVAQRWPASIRIGLSGQTDVDTAYASTEVTHQFLSKPCDPQRLKEALVYAGRLQARLADPALASLLGDLRNVPSLPGIFRELTAEMDSPGCSIARIGEIVERDIAMTAKLLRLVNSAYFGLRHEITSAATAASYLGLDTLRTLVLGVHVFDTGAEQSLGRLNIEDLWRHSSRMAAVAKQFSIAAGHDRQAADSAFMAGMLHDIGVLVLAASQPSRYDEVLKIAAERGMPTWQIEIEKFSRNHMDIGGYLLGIWGLPRRVVDAVAFHHHPSLLQSNEQNPVLTAVHVAGCIADDLDGARFTGESVHRDQAYIDALGIDQLITSVTHDLRRKQAA